MISRLFRRAPVIVAPSSLPPGQRIYAIGDIHGRLDLLDTLLAAISADDDARGAGDTTLIFLGDLIDRGPDSRGVIERLIALPAAVPCRFLLGNHEEVFLEALAGDRRALRGFCRIGGRETILSYGVDTSAYDRMDYDHLAATLDEIVPATHRHFLQSFEDRIVIGDYLFVHAGIEPGVPIEEQTTNSLRWIREPFLEYRGHLEKLVVHGHTISEQVEFLPHRIGIDTGAWRSGRLTALGLDGTERWTLQT